MPNTNKRSPLYVPADAASLVMSLGHAIIVISSATVTGAALFLAVGEVINLLGMWEQVQSQPLVLQLAILFGSYLPGLLLGGFLADRIGRGRGYW